MTCPCLLLHVLQVYIKKYHMVIYLCISEYQTEEMFLTKIDTLMVNYFTNLHDVQVQMVCF